MKLIDENGKIGSKVSIVDLFALFLVLACIAAVGLKMQAVKTVKGGDVAIEYKVRVENVRKMSVDAMRQSIGEDGAIDIESKYELGKIVDVKAQPARVLVQTNDGKISLAEYDDRYDVYLTLEAEGRETEDGYYTHSGRQLSVGATVGIKAKYSQFYAEITEVKVK